MNKVYFFFKIMFLFLFWGSTSQRTLAQTISGTVFNDGNNNGIKDIGESGFPYVTIKAYDNSNVLVTTTSSLATPTANIGDYALSGLSTGAIYRIEFTLPKGYSESAFGIENSSVKFVATNTIRLWKKI